MVIGTGMIANKFIDYADRKEKIIFASGVSNSKNTNKQNFLRELNLLSDTIKSNPRKSLVYFSTCSIEDKELKYSPYILHKIEIEKFIKLHVEKFFIFRISNVAGVSNNPYTLLNYFVFNILGNHAFSIWKNAYRNIIGIDDVYQIVHQILENDLYVNEITNIANPKNYSVPFIVREIEKHLNKKAFYKEVNRGSDYHIDITPIELVINKCNIQFSNDYLAFLLKKYYHSK